MPNPIRFPSPAAYAAALEEAAAKRVEDAQRAADDLGREEGRKVRTEEAKTMFRNTIARYPRFGREWVVTSIDTEPAAPDVMWFSLSTGDVIRIDISVEMAVER